MAQRAAGAPRELLGEVLPVLVGRIQAGHDFTPAPYVQGCPPGEPLWKGSKAAGREPSLTSMDIHTPSIPPKLRITQTLVEDLFYRPVDVAKVIWPDIELDWFQRTRLKRFCLTPRVIDLSGVGTGKTVVTIWDGGIGPMPTGRSSSRCRGRASSGAISWRRWMPRATPSRSRRRRGSRSRRG